jgi:hypothetical protein
MTVFCKEKGDQLWMYLLVAAEVSAEEAAYEISIYRSVITGEMYIFK